MSSASAIRIVRIVTVVPNLNDLRGDETHLTMRFCDLRLIGNSPNSLGFASSRALNSVSSIHDTS